MVVVYSPNGMLLRIRNRSFCIKCGDEIVPGKKLCVGCIAKLRSVQKGQETETD